MRILFVSASSGSEGGGELYLLYLAQELRAQGCETLLWCSNHPSLDKLATQFETVGKVHRSNYVNTYRKPFRSLSYVIPPSYSERLRREWEALRPDVIHINKQALEDGLDLLQAANSLNTPHCATIHITQTARELKAVGAPLRDWVSRRVLQSYKGTYIAISPRRAKELQAFVGNWTPVRHVDNGVAIPSESEKADLREKGRKVLLGTTAGSNVLCAVAVGRLEAQKRPLLFLQMARALREREPRAMFYWIGDGRLRPDWDAEVERLGLNDCVKCLGWQDNVMPYLAAADVFLHPAAFEGLPFALLEALAWGLPCVIQPELAQELGFSNGDCLWVADGDTWTSRVVDPEERRKISDRAVQKVRDSYSREQMAARHLKIYRTISGSSSPTPVSV